MQKLLIFFFSKNVSVYVIVNNLNCNDTLTYDIVSFEQMGPDPAPMDLRSLQK